jgi:hypothetical protein
MKVLVLDLSANVRGFENDLSRKITDILLGLSIDAEAKLLTSTLDIPEFIADVCQIHPDFTVLVAHGAEDEPVARIRVGDDTSGHFDDPYFLQKMFPNVFMSHKLLLVCEGLTRDTMAGLHANMPDSPVDPTGVLIASLEKVEEIEAERFAEVLFSEYIAINDVHIALERAREAVGDAGPPYRWHIEMPIDVCEG